MSGEAASALSIPDMVRMLSFGARHNPDVWDKHRKEVPNCPALAAALCAAGAQEKFQRRHVFAVAGRDTAAGAIAAMVWGFPRGGPRGQHQGFVKAFRTIDSYARILDDARAHRRAANETLFAMNEIVSGVGFATTTKMMYFAGLQFHEGNALIFDRNVIEAIRETSGKWSRFFPRTREALGSTHHWYGRASKAYGAFVREASDLAAVRSAASDAICSAQIETALFLAKAPKGTWD